MAATLPDFFFSCIWRSEGRRINFSTNQKKTKPAADCSYVKEDLLNPVFISHDAVFFGLGTWTTYSGSIVLAISPKARKTCFPAEKNMDNISCYGDMFIYDL
jgi:hypothetical protein